MAGDAFGDRKRDSGTNLAVAEHLLNDELDLAPNM